MSTSRCPACGAAVRSGAPWCQLCHRDLRPAPAPVAARLALADQQPDAKPGTRPDDPSGGTTAPAARESCHAGPSPTWPCVVCGVDNDLEAPACTGCGAGFLAALRRADQPVLLLPGVGDVTRMSRAARLGLAVGLGLLVALLLVGLALLAGRVL